MNEYRIVKRTTHDGEVSFKAQMGDADMYFCDLVKVGIEVKEYHEGGDDAGQWWGSKDEAMKIVELHKNKNLIPKPNYEYFSC